MKTITVNLNSESINDAIAMLEQIKKRITNRPRVIVEELLRIGITTAQENTGKYAGYIKFETVTKPSSDGFIGLLIGSATEPMISRWRRGGEVIEAEVNPLLMAEFGSGHYANVPEIWSDLVGFVGQGTFTYPDQIRNHAFDKGWGWYDLENNWHWSTGESPTAPMYKSWEKMRESLLSVIANDALYG